MDGWRESDSESQFESQNEYDHGGFRTQMKNKRRRFRTGSDEYNNRYTTQNGEVNFYQNINSHDNNSTSPNTKLVLLISSPSQDLTAVNPMVIQKELYDTIGVVKKIDKTNKGAIAITCVDPPQYYKAKRMKDLLGRRINVNVPTSLTTSRGCIYNVPLEVNEEDILDVLKVQKVTKVKRLNYYDKAKKKPVPSTTLCLTFDSPNLPDRINLGYNNYRVKVFIQKTLQCYKCQRYGHHSAQCKGQERCRKCGDNHRSDDCQASTVKCANCKGDHNSNSKDCPWYEKTKQANKVMATQKMTFKEAIVYNEKKEKSEKDKSQERDKEKVKTQTGADKDSNKDKKGVETLVKKENLVSFVYQMCKVYENIDKSHVEQRHETIARLCKTYLHFDITNDKLVEANEIGKDCFKSS